MIFFLMKRNILNIYKTKIFKRENVFKEFDIEGHFVNNDIIINNVLDGIEIKDRKSKNIEYIKMRTEIFIFNKENLFRLYIR